MVRDSEAVRLEALAAQDTNTRKQVVPSQRPEARLTKICPARGHGILLFSQKYWNEIKALKNRDDKHAVKIILSTFRKLEAGASLNITLSDTRDSGEFDFFGTIDNVSVHCVAYGKRCEIVGIASIDDLTPRPDDDPDPEPMYVDDGSGDGPCEPLPLRDCAIRMRRAVGMRALINCRDNDNEVLLVEHTRFPVVYPTEALPRSLSFFALTIRYVEDLLCISLSITIHILIQFAKTRIRCVIGTGWITLASRCRAHVLQPARPQQSHAHIEKLRSHG